MKFVLNFLRKPVPLAILDVVYFVHVGPALISADSTPLVLLGIGLGLGLGYLTYKTIKEGLNK